MLEAWRSTDGRTGLFTSVASWRGPNGPIDYRGVTYGLRVHEFRNFLSLPRRTGQSFQIALNIHPDERDDLRRLDREGWTLVDPRVVARDPWTYQCFVEDSLAEFSVAKQLYVRSCSGWFSDRSIYYLASGRPVVAQDTGLGGRYPSDAGLLWFTTLDEAAAAVLEVARDSARHARAARAVAEEYFDSDKVLSRLLGRLGMA